MFTDLALQVALVGLELWAVAMFTDLSLQITPCKEDEKKQKKLNIKFGTQKSHQASKLKAFRGCGNNTPISRNNQSTTALLRSHFIFMLLLLFF
jgi:hypothetical protein